MPFFLCSLGLPACHGGRLGCLPGCPAWRASLCRDEGPGAERRAQVCRGRAPGRRICPLASSARLFTDKVPLPSPLRLTHCWDPSTQLESLQTKQRLPSSPQLRVPTHGLAGPSSPPGWEYGPGLQRVEEPVPRKSRPWGGWGPSPWRCCSSDGTWGGGHTQEETGVSLQHVSSTCRAVPDRCSLLPSHPRCLLRKLPQPPFLHTLG